jgi:hypothetical protein
LPGEAPKAAAINQPSANRVQKMREITENPFVGKVREAIDGEIIRVDPPNRVLPSSNPANTNGKQKGSI